MKLTIAAALLFETCIGKETVTSTLSEPLATPHSHHVLLSHSQRRRLRILDHDNRRLNDSSNPNFLDTKPLSSSETHTPRLRSTGTSSGTDHRIGRATTLKNVTRTHHARHTDERMVVVECLPPQKQNRSTTEAAAADVGILGCGVGEYCRESADATATTLGGICVQAVQLDIDEAAEMDLEGPTRPSRRHQRLFSFLHNLDDANMLLKGCDPSVDPSSGCALHQECVQNDASEKGGFCVDTSSGPTSFRHRFRSLQSTYPYTEFFDFIQYSCSYDTDPFTCECTSDADTGSTAVTCEYTAPCESSTTPCMGDNSTIEYCKKMNIEAQGTGPKDFEFNLCYGYLSPVDMTYCYQVISDNGLLTCTMNMNDEQCASCDLDPQDICIDFDCSNTASGRAGSLCSDSPLGYPALLDLLECSGSCNICGEGGKLVNYNYDLSPILSSVVDCYSPLLCDGRFLSCEQLQEFALTGGLGGLDSCNVAPDVDLYSLCCVEPSPDNPPPSDDDTPGQIRCEALDHDCFSCIENDDCFWCPGDALCSSSTTFVDPVNVFEREHSCKTPEDYKTDTCTDPPNFFSDPLYSSQKWIFDMIKVREVWEKGYTGNGIRVRVNDEGIESSHPEFEGRIDVDASCPSEVEPLSSAYESGFSHGTAVASILGAAGGNDVCGVGIAPNVTISSCYFNTNQEFAELFVYKLDSFDISQNSWGRDTCRDLDDDGRRLQGKKCPFTYDQSHVFPCLICDFSNIQAGECVEAIELHCKFYFREDRLGCLEHLDLTLGGNCDFESLTNENRDAFVKGVAEGREGKGVVYVFASGNSLNRGADTNFEGFGTNTRMAMAVGAVGKDGIVATYSTPGASIFVSAPGGDVTNSVSNMITASVNGRCTDSGQGTSFAAPVLSGVVALILEANDQLTYRDVQAILATTSQPVDDELDYTSGVNAANIWHSNYYGFGIVNALAAVESAKSWETVGNETMAQVNSDTLNVQIPDDETKPIVESLEVSPLNSFTIESVYVYLRLEHSSRGHLQIKLRSPSGTESILSPGRRPENTQQSGSEWWKLLSWKFWGESPNGEWTMSVVDLKKGDATFEGTCADYEWSFIDRVTCSVLEKVQYCEGKKIDPYRIALKNGEHDIIFSHQYQGLTAGEACCACGGGVDTRELSDSLLQWKLVIYGEGSADGDQMTLSPTTAPSFAPSSSPSNGTTSPATSFPTSALLPESLPPFQEQEEIIRKEAIGDTYFFRNEVLQKAQPSPTEETMLIRNGFELKADAFSLVSFPFQGLLGLGIDDLTSESFESRAVLTEICLSHVQKADGGNVSTYALCRVKPESWSVADGDGSDLETYQGTELTGLKIPDDCMGDELGLVTFEIFPNETFTCIEVADLLMLPNPSTGLRQELPSIFETNEDIIMFLIDSFGEDGEVEDRFYTVNSNNPPLMIFYHASTDAPTTFEDNTTVPVETQSPTPSPSVNRDDPALRHRGLFGLLGLLLLCPLFFVCFVRRNKGKTKIKDGDTEELRDESFEAEPIITATVEFLNPDKALVDSSTGLAPNSPPLSVDVEGNKQGSPSDEEDSSSDEDETDGGWESDDGHTTDSDGTDSSSSSSGGDANTNDDTFEDETYDSPDDDSGDL